MAERNGNGQKKYWFIIPAITVASVLFGAGVSTTTVRKDVETNCKVNAVQDQQIKANADAIKANDEDLARTEERWIAIRESLARIESQLTP